MTKKRRIRCRRLSHEIILLIGFSALMSLGAFLLLSGVAMGVAEEYIFNRDIPMTEFDWIELEHWIFSFSLIVAVGLFSVLFLARLGERLTYIRKLTDAIDVLGSGVQQEIPLEGNNELTALAGAINQMSAAQRQLREKEQTLAAEKDQLIRTLSHDIRTPLTSVLAYSEYLAARPEDPEVREGLAIIRKKAEQIKDLTDVLLEGGKRNVEQIDDGHLLMEQLAAEWEEELEDRFAVVTDLSECAAFAGRFDVQELRRVFDNLSTNVQKYADPAQKVELTIGMSAEELQIRQRNAVGKAAPERDGYQLGIQSIRRIAQSYGGRVDVWQTAEEFTIHIVFSEF